jgi:hypothetical protein
MTAISRFAPRLENRYYPCDFLWEAYFNVSHTICGALDHISFGAARMHGANCIDASSCPCRSWGARFGVRVLGVTRTGATVEIF